MVDGDSGMQGTHKLSISLLIVIRIMRSATAGIINLVFPYMVLSEMRHGSLVLGLIYTAATISTALLAVAIGFVADVSRKWTYVCTLALLPVSVAVLTLSSGVAALSVAAVVGGYSATGSLAGGGIGGAVQPIQSAITSDVTAREERTTYFSRLGFLAAMSSAGSAFVSGVALTTHSASFAELVLLALVMGIASTVPALFIKTRERKRRGKMGLKNGRAIGKFTLTGMLNGFSNGLITPFLIPFFILAYGVPAGQMGLYASASGLIGGFSLLLAPRIERALGFLRGILVTRGVNIVLALVFPFVHVLYVSVLLYLFFPALRVAALPVQQTALTDMVADNELGRAFGINQASRLLVGSTGTAFSGYEFDVSQVEIPFISYAVVLGLNLYLYTRFFSTYRSPLS